MAATGLVDAIFADGKTGPFTSTIRVLPGGHAFLRTFRDLPISRPSASLQRG